MSKEITKTLNEISNLIRLRITIDDGRRKRAQDRDGRKYYEGKIAALDALLGDIANIDWRVK
jgi:hypothetical protein